MRCFILLVFLLVIFKPSAVGQIINREVVRNDSILIHSDIKDESVRFIIDSISLTGNKQTRENIILRELVFFQNDTIPAFSLVEIIRKSRENLLNTSLFNFVTVEDSIISRGSISHIIIKINFVERWYLWPFPIFEISGRNFNSWWEEKDFSKVNYGMFFIKENCRGRMESLKLLLRLGYDEKYEVSYDIPYINEKQTFGAGLGAGWSQNHEVAYQTVDNKLVYVHNEQDYMIKNYFSYFNLTHRPNFYQHHLFQASYNFYSFADTVLNLNPDYSYNNDKTNEYFTLFYKFAVDHRDFKVYPLQGLYYDFSISKSGLGILKNGDISMMDIAGSFRKYWELSKKIHVSTDLSGKISTNRDQPYFFQQGMGYGRNFVRGYELYVIEGQSYWLSKNTFKYSLVPTQERKIGFIKSEKFGKVHYALYINCFFDLGYVHDYNNIEYNSMSNKLLFGSGIGIDLVTYYDMVFRVEYSVNRMGETGFYVHFKDTL
ncbi:MAG: hypothetical protein B6I19_04755 [Bacteroidetes bacterium 4572_114]|nr:MAG: hypothetical protein B6I19_04755 [Bacteroidetes bacterium 4572_114]